MDWGIVGVGLRSSRMRAALAPQDCLYTMLERAPAVSGRASSGPCAAASPAGMTRRRCCRSWRGRTPG